MSVGPHHLSTDLPHGCLSVTKVIKCSINPSVPDKVLIVASHFEIIGVLLSETFHQLV